MSFLDKIFGRTETEKADDAAAPANVYPFVVPNYRRGGPYSSEAVPTYSDSEYRSGVRDRYESPTEQHREWPRGWGPPSTMPPGQWIGYNQDNIQRSRRDEQVLNADEGPTEWIAQERWRPAHNPYYYRNNSDRIQRPPHEYSMIRKADKNYLGNRTLSGNHYSQAQMVSDEMALSLKGMVPSKNRRSVERVEPIAYGEMTNTRSGRRGFVKDAAYTAPEGAPSASFRLS